MTVASWEFWSLATMLIATHGDEAEAEAARRLQEAQAATILARRSFGPKSAVNC